MHIAMSKPLTDDDLDAFDDLLHTLAERADLPLSLEGVDGFVAALASGPRPLEAGEYLTELVGEVRWSVPAERENLIDFIERRRAEIARGLAAPVDTLADPRAFSPFLMDWQGVLADLPEAERAAAKAEGVPLYAELWAEGYLFAVDSWAQDWALPDGSKDEQFVDACLAPFYTLTTPRDEWTPQEKKLSRDEHVAQAIWGVYELNEFWRDRGLGPRVPVRVDEKPGRNDLCHCGSGKKFKKCCGAG